MAERKEILKLRDLLDEYNINYVYRKHNYDYENAETIEKQKDNPAAQSSIVAGNVRNN